MYFDEIGCLGCAIDLSVVLHKFSVPFVLLYLQGLDTPNPVLIIGEKLKLVRTLSTDDS